MKFTIEFEQEEDGRWLAEVLELPGVMVYGQSRQEAMAKAQALALRVVAERLEHGEMYRRHVHGISYTPITLAGSVLSSPPAATLSVPF